MKTQKTQIENRLRISIDDETWLKITSKFIKTDDGFTSLTVNKRLKKALISRENGKLGGRPPKEETQKTQPDNLKRKRKGKEREIIGSGEKVVFVKAVYANDSILEIHDLQEYFKRFDQLQSFIDKGWVHFDAFMDENPGKIFDDEGHLYNTFRNFSIRYTPPARAPNEFITAEVDKSNLNLDAWEKVYAFDLKNNDKFRKHFGYNGKFSPS